MPAFGLAALIGGSAAFGLALIAVATTAGPAFAIANPAAVFCVQSGGRTQVVETPQGEMGICILPGGEMVEEWAYFRAHSPPAPALGR